jgi:glycosyltransferase involved in cell wall biosynthesis
MTGNETVRRDPEGIAPSVSVIVPARNEEASLGTCLESLVSQSGVDFEIIVIDDHSTDRTHEIAASFAGVSVIEAGPLPAGWTGKNNAVVTGVGHARCEWLLFMDADTVQLPGSLARALEEAREYRVDMLSYSPEQIAVTFWEMAVLPVVFAELAQRYPPSKVSDPNSPAAAANGQYILVRREAYNAVGGHAAVAGEILEDVALARRFKARGEKIRFRYGSDAVRTRMYRNWPQLRDGWTKNLALLFPRSGRLAAKILFLWFVFWFALVGTLASYHGRRIGGLLFLSLPVFLLVGAHLKMRLRCSNFPARVLGYGVLVGMPTFAYLLLRSKCAHAKGSVRWKGRTYSEKLVVGH